MNNMKFAAVSLVHVIVISAIAYAGYWLGHMNHHLHALGVFLGLLGVICGSGSFLLFVVQRLQAMGWVPIFAAAVIVPFLALCSVLVLMQQSPIESFMASGEGSHSAWLYLFFGWLAAAAFPLYFMGSKRSA